MRAACRGLRGVWRQRALPVKRLLAPVSRAPVSPTATNPRREQISAIRLTVGSGLSGEWDEAPRRRRASLMLREERLEPQESSSSQAMTMAGRHARRLHARDDLVAVPSKASLLRWLCNRGSGVVCTVRRYRRCLRHCQRRGRRKFHPDGAITVQEAATMTARAAVFAALTRRWTV